jgi:DNA repair protein RecO (recombination protein O)
MISRSYSDEGLVLARRNYGEADRILSLYTQNHGRISVIAKGIRRLSSKKRGHLEVFSHFKFQVARGRNLDILTEAEIINNFSGVRKSLAKASLAFYFMEVIGRTTREGEPHREVFDLILKYLQETNRKKNLKSIRLDFILKLLTVLGFWPQGKKLLNPDAKLEEVIERSLSSERVGKKMLQ